VEPYLFWTAYLGLGLVATVFEVVRPAHRVSYRKGLPLDLAAMTVYQFGIAPLALLIVRQVQIRYSFIDDVPLAVRIAAVYLIADCGSYWMHRLMHTRHVWRIHRFHHSPQQLYWLAGVRATLPQQLLFNIPYIFVGPLVIEPQWVLPAMMVEGIARNHFQHMNFAWRSNWLEWIFVTPRYHHIHHSTNVELHDGNYGSLFTFWDRLFGTRVDPETHPPKKFGTGEPKRDPVLLMIGI